MLVRGMATALALMSLTVATARADEYRKATDVERLEAYCHTVAAGGEQGQAAFGTLVSAAVGGLGGLIGNVVAHQQAYEHCMTYHGYARADGYAVHPSDYAPTRAAALRPAPVVHYKRYKLGE